MHILFISNHFPDNLETCTQGIYQRMTMFFDSLSQLGSLEILFFVPTHIGLDSLELSKKEKEYSHYWNTPVKLIPCPQISQATGQPKWQQQWGGIFNFFQQSDYVSSPQEIQALEEYLSEHPPELLFMHRLSCMSRIMKLKAKLPPILFDLDDIEHIKFMRQVRQPPTRLRTLLYYFHVPARWWGEQKAIRLADRTFICSDLDRHYLSHQLGLPGIQTIPNSITIPPAQPLTSEPTLMLIGGYYYFPNANAANFLIEQVWPYIHRQMPNAKLIIAGKAPQHIRSYSKNIPGIEFTGFVDDLDALYQRTRVVCCPIFSGGGTRVKMIEAAAYGKPMVATRIGAEGLEMTDGKEFLLRDRPQDFAEACLELLRNDALCQSLGAAARQVAIQNYDRNYIIPKIQDCVRSVLAEAPAPVTQPSSIVL